MNTLDIVLILIFVVAFFIGFQRGLLLALFSLIGVITGVYGALYFSSFATAYLNSWFDWEPSTTAVVAFVITFLIIVIAFSLIGNLLTKIADFAMLGIFNKILGGIFNALKYAFVMSVILMFLNHSKNYSSIIFSDEAKLDSVIYKPVTAIAPLIVPRILNEIESLDQPQLNPEIPEDVPTEE